MTAENKQVKYPENLAIAVEVFKSGLTQDALAERIGCSRQTLNQTLNGHYKGVNIIHRLKAELGIK